MAVSKTRTAEMVESAARAGINEFGENYLSEALEKQSQLQHLALTWHFIGPIQSNKTRAIAEQFDWVHSVDRLKIAQRLADQRPAQLAPLNICLQVNISSEDSKSGVSLTQLPELAAAVHALPSLRLRGLMAIPRASADSGEQRAAFTQLAAALRSMTLCASEQQAHWLDTLSMGMSADMDAAIAEGATIVRIGTDIFGPRASPPVEPIG